MIKQRIEHKKIPSRILVISDLHFPNEHKDAFSFLNTIKKQFKPNFVVQIGDIVDIGSISSYALDPEYISPKDEFDKSMEKLKKFYKMFPKCHLIVGNHEIRVVKKASNLGIPSCYLKNFKELFQMPKNWDVSFELVLGSKILFTHGVHKKPLKLAQQKMMSTVEGHFHIDMSVNWWQNDYNEQLFCVRTGCLIDDKSVVFQYNKRDSQRPCYGCAVIENGIPRIIGMRTDKQGKWVGKL